MDSFYNGPNPQSQAIIALFDQRVLYLEAYGKRKDLFSQSAVLETETTICDEWSLVYGEWVEDWNKFRGTSVDGYISCYYQPMDNLVQDNNVFNQYVSLENRFCRMIQDYEVPLLVSYHKRGLVDDVPFIYCFPYRMGIMRGKNPFSFSLRILKTG